MVPDSHDNQSQVIDYWQDSGIDFTKQMCQIHLLHFDSFEWLDHADHVFLTYLVKYEIANIQTTY